MNVQNMLLMLHSLGYSLTDQLVLGTALILGYPCDNIGLVLACLLTGVHMSLHHLAIMTQPSGIPILSPIHFIMLAIPIFPLFKFVDLLVLSMNVCVQYFIAMCSPSCQNGGTCSSPNSCSCRSGWSGSSCSQRMLQSQL